MNVKELITQDFLRFKKMHVFKNVEAKVSWHVIYGKILMAAQLQQLTLDDANHLIEVLFALYDTLDKPY